VEERGRKEAPLVFVALGASPGLTGPAVWRGGAFVLVGVAWLWAQGPNQHAAEHRNR
jgi:hypothetical protein